MSLAYKVESPDSEDGAVIVFGDSYRTLRKLGACRLGFYFEENEYSCCRAKEFDQFAELGFVPDVELLKAGWYVFTNHWQATLNESMTKEEYASLEAEYPEYMDGAYVEELLIETQDRRGIYCCMEEVEDHAYFLDEFYEAAKKFKEYVINTYPQIEVSKWDIDYPNYTKIAEFSFPGSKYKSHVRWQTHEEPIDTVGIYVANGDLEAFNLWRETWQK